MIAYYPILQETVCSAMKSTETYKQMLPETNKLANSFALDQAWSNVDLRSERPFSTLQRLLTTYEQRRLTNVLILACMFLHTQHQEITDDRDLVQVARNFVDANNERKRYIGPANYFFVNIKTFCLLYIHHCDSITSVCLHSANCSLRLFTIFWLLQHAIYFCSVE